MNSYRTGRADTNPATENLGERVAVIIAEILEIETPPPDEAFHQLGGTSLAAAVVLATLWEETGGAPAAGRAWP